MLIGRTQKQGKTEAGRQRKRERESKRVSDRKTQTKRLSWCLRFRQFGVQFGGSSQ